MDIAIGTSPDTNSNAIPDECEYYHQPYPYCYAGLGQADITAYGDSMVVSNIGSTSDDGVRLQSDGPEDLIFRCDLSHIDLSIPDAAVAFQFNGSTATSRIPSSAQSPQSTVLSGCGIANSGGALQVVGDFNPLGDPNVLMQVYNAGVKAGESSIPGGGVIAIGNDAGYGLPSVIGVEMDATDPPTFTVTLDRVTQFNLIGGSVFDGDEIRLVCENATEAIEGLTSFDITGKNLEYFVITDIEITSGSCCRGFTGNVDNDPTDMVDLGDLTALIDYLFISFTPPVCMEEANIDGDPAGTVDLGDLTALIDFLFISFTPPAECQ